MGHMFFVHFERHTRQIKRLSPHRQLRTIRPRAAVLSYVTKKTIVQGQKHMSGADVKISSQCCSCVNASIIPTARSDLGLTSIWRFEGILVPSVSNGSKAQNSLSSSPEDRVLVLGL